MILTGKQSNVGLNKQFVMLSTGPIYRNPMQIRYNWAKGVTETIDWEEVHCQSMHTQISHKTHYVKLCHDILPTGNVVRNYGQSLPNYCPLCKASNGAFHHVTPLVMPAPHSLQKWRNDLLSTLKTKCLKNRPNFT